MTQSNISRVDAKRRPQRAWLHLPAATDAAICGAKAASLARLRARHPVPDGFVLPIALCEELDSTPSKALRTAVAEGLAQIGDGPVAVRSSAVAEDGNEASFAGQFVTVLDVSGVDDVCAAVLRCLASANAANVKIYADADADLRMAVLIQRMVEADAAGVAFSVNPVTGDDEVTIAAVRGLGDKLVDGSDSGESWTLIDARVTQAPPAPTALSEGDALRIAALTTTLATERDEPQDVEWAVANGELFLLQSRAVTAVPLKPSFADDPTDGVWTRDNVHYPTGVSAFAASTYQRILSQAIGETFRAHGVMLDGMEVHWRSGELYGRMLAPGGKDGPAPPWWVIALVARIVPAVRARMRCAAQMFADGTMESRVQRWHASGRAALDGEIRRGAATDLDALSDDGLLEHVDGVLDLMLRGQRIHFELFMPYVVGLHRFRCVAHELLGWADERILSLLAGSSTTSSAPARELEQIAVGLRKIEGARAALDTVDPVASVRALDAGAADALAEWLERWGLRAINYDSASPTYSEQPALLFGLVKEAVDADLAAPSSGVAAEVIDEARRSLHGRDLARFDAALEEAKQIYPLREDNVLYTDNLINGLARRALLAMGRRLCARGLLRSPEQAADLMIDELRAALVGERDDTLELAKRRRAECAWVAAHPGPSVLCGEVHAPPSMKGLPEKGRIINEAILWAVSLEFPELSGGAPPPREEGHLSGIGAWPGSYTGIARIVRSEADFPRVRPGDVLVATITTPAWSMVFPRIGALVTDEGGALSHAAIVAREHGIPTVMNTKMATRNVTDGALITVDGTRGTVRIDKPNA